MKPFMRSAVCIAVVVVAGACSSTSSKSSAPTTTTAVVTKAAYLARANAICKTMNERIQSLANPGHDPLKLADTADRATAIIDQTLHRLRALPVPTGEGQELAAVYGKVDAATKDAGEYSSALRAQNLPAVRAAGTKLDADQKEANAASIRYGLTVCGK